MTIDTNNVSLNDQAASTIAGAEKEITTLTANLSGDITDDNGVCGTTKENFGTDSHVSTASDGHCKDVSLVEFMELSGKASRKVQGATDAMSQGKNIMKSAERAAKAS